MKIILCEDQKILLDGIAATLSKEKSFSVVGTVTSADMILPLLKKTSADVILTDVVTDDKKNALDSVEEWKKESPSVKVVAITGFPDIAFLERAKKVGVDSFVYKNVSSQELVGILKNTVAGYSIYPTEEKTKDLFLTALTETERKVLRLYCAGLDRAEIAEELFLSQSSVKSYVSSILKKTGFGSIARVAIYATSNGLIVVE